MHIAFLTAEYPPQPGGVGDYTRCLASALATRGHTVTVVTGCGKTEQFVRGGSEPSTCQAHHDVNGEKRAFQVVRSISSWGWRCWPEIIATLDMLRPDGVHIQYQTGAYGMHPAINLLPWRLRGLPNRPHIAVTFHDVLEPYLFPKAGALRCWVTMRLAHDADVVVATCAEDVAQLRQSNANIVRIPIGSNIAVAPPANYNRVAWRASLGVGPDAVLIAYFGLFSHAKGIDTLLYAWKHLREQAGSSGRSMYLLLIGGAATAPQDRAYAAYIYALLDELQIRESTILTGHVDSADVSGHLLAADCVALPFRQGVSLRRGSLLAALSHGVPVVTTRPASQEGVAYTTDFVDGEHVLLVPPDDSLLLAGALQRVTSGARLREHLSRGARALSTQFGWGDIAERHEQVHAAVGR